jgi:hypothetical protein
LAYEREEIMEKVKMIFDWINIKEKKPEKSGRYLFFYNYRYENIPGNITKSFHNEIFIGRVEIRQKPGKPTKYYKWFTGGRLVSKITHYMELPNFPNEDNNL